MIDPLPHTVLVVTVPVGTDRWSFLRGWQAGVNQRSPTLGEVFASGVMPCCHQRFAYTTESPPLADFPCPCGSGCWVVRWVENPVTDWVVN